MTKYRSNLPQLNGGLFLTDGGLETTLIFDKGISLPFFAAFDILNSEARKKLMFEYYTNYLKIAKKNRTGFILESPTWRANSDWGEQMGYNRLSLALKNIQAVKLLEQIRQKYIMLVLRNGLKWLNYLSETFQNLPKILTGNFWA